MLHRKYTRVPSATNWENYRRQRNLVVRLRKSSRTNYLKSMGKGSSNAQEFWSSVKPLMSNKSNEVSEDLVLIELKKAK